jgi:hypothetical protein
VVSVQIQTLRVLAEEVERDSVATRTRIAVSQARFFLWQPKFSKNPSLAFFIQN